MEMQKPRGAPRGHLVALGRLTVETQDVLSALVYT